MPSRQSQAAQGLQSAAIAGICLSGLLFLIPPALGLDSIFLVQGLRQAAIWKADTPINVDPTGEGEVTVTTLKNPKATPSDCKIDAVLVAKKLMDLDQKDIKRVRVNFFLSRDYYDNTRDTVVVREGDVKAYAAKAIAEKDLLESLSIATIGGADKVAALSVKGAQPLQIDELGEMISLAGHLKMLESQAVDVSQFQPLLTELIGEVDKRSPTAPLAIAQVGHRLQAFERLEVPGGAAPNAVPDATAVRPAVVPFNWKPLFARINMQLRDILGLQAPIRGRLPAQRCRLIAKIRDLQQQGANVDDALRSYGNLQEIAAGPFLPVRQGVNNLVDLLNMQGPDKAPAPSPAH